MLEDVLVSLMLLVVGVVGTVGLFWSATEKLRVLFSCLAWRRVEAVVTSSRVAKERSTRHVARLDPHAPRGEGVEVSPDGFGGGTVTTTTVMPQVFFRFFLGERAHVVSNLDASWNHSIGYAQSDAADWVQHFARGTKHRLRVNPRRPSEVFVGWRHFPYVWTPIELVLGFFLGITPLVAVIKPALGWIVEDEHVAAQKLLVALACCSPFYAVARAVLDAARGERAPVT